VALGKSKNQTLVLNWAKSAIFQSVGITQCDNVAKIFNTLRALFNMEWKCVGDFEPA
jgi:hypothetical protein